MVILREKEGDCTGKVIYLLSFLVQPFFANIKCDVFNNGTSFLSFLLSSLTHMLSRYAPIISHYFLSLTIRPPLLPPTPSKGLPWQLRCKETACNVGDWVQCVPLSQHCLMSSCTTFFCPFLNPFLFSDPLANALVHQLGSVQSLNHG